MTWVQATDLGERRQRAAGCAARLYPNCGCPPDNGWITNVVCRNVDCPDYGTHRRGAEGDHCNHCGVLFTLLAEDIFRGAR